MSNFERVPAEEWKEWCESNGAIVLDVREPDEWALGTLPESTLISVGDIITEADGLDKKQPVLCVCHSGGRSAEVATYLSGIGFEKVANMVGGVKALGMQD